MLAKKEAGADIQRLELETQRLEEALAFAKREAQEAVTRAKSDVAREMQVCRKSLNRRKRALLNSPTNTRGGTRDAGVPKEP